VVGDVTGSGSFQIVEAAPVRVSIFVGSQNPSFQSSVSAKD
jgi:hypothetical protein